MSIAAYKGVCPTCRHDHSAPITALASGSGDHAELARLAEAATPGPWEATGTTVWREEAVPIPVTVCCGNGLPSGECCGNGVEDCEWDLTQGEIANAGSNDAAFIAAANPATVLALIAEVAALREDLNRKHEACQIAQDQAMENGSRARKAERKLAEADQVIHDIADTPYSGADWPRSRAATYLASKEAERG